MSAASTFLSFSFPDDNGVHILSVAEFSQANSDDPDMVADALAAIARGEEFHGGGGAQPLFVIAPATLDQLADNLPDVPDLVMAIRGVIDTSDAYRAAFPDVAEDQSTPLWQARVEAFDRLRSLHLRCEAYLKAVTPPEDQDA